MLAAFGHLEDIPADPRAWPDSVRSRDALARTLVEHRQEALLYRTLATLRTDAPVDTSLSALEHRGCPASHSSCSPVRWTRRGSCLAWPAVGGVSLDGGSAGREPQAEGSPGVLAAIDPALAPPAWRRAGASCRPWSCSVSAALFVRVLWMADLRNVVGCSRTWGRSRCSRWCPTAWR